ncbi:PREDICTED: TAF6-like RNA polymerase II p300/CBP-associated factor-associated factor 65 kDa subunit 6L [Acropora digitifera]|uniref:TAF6-like RNA polymerase II p300/CBP-associated factor-associated factor 65 kDa subunit 6L n=1 Tax=Acropora digitifera TaxID=70779 RepID=UPI00077AE675|nr:PREDICTED: TAF6-like RNA polymerase II p300/CBP-associated factor-associated factor 65 kDa subunit 6L [Acropora digitifera]
MIKDQKTSMTHDSKFAIISPKSVKLFAEIVGAPGLTDDLASSLAEDATYRLRETLQSAAQYMKHGKRRRLTCEDFNKALERSSTELIYGYGSLEDTLFRSTISKEGEIFFVEDKEIGLRELAMNVAIPTDPGKRTVKGNLCYAPVIRNPHSGLSGAFIPKFDANDILQVALRDLQTNPKLSSLLSHFVNFIASAVKSYGHDLTQLSKLLSLVRSLIENQSLFLEPYVIQLVTSVMYCLLESLAVSLNPQNDHWRLRDDAAHILARISRKCSNPVNYLRQQLLMTLQEVLLDDGRPFCSHYGAVVGLTELGSEALEQYMLPHLRPYWNQLQQVLDDSSQTNALLQDEAYQVYGALLKAAGCLLKCKQHGVPMNPLGFPVNNSHPVFRSNLSPWAGTSVVQYPAPVVSTRSRSSSTGLAYNPFQLYQQLHDVFGDSLGPIIAQNNWQDAVVTKNNQLRMQPFAHAYYPLRPLPRDVHTIKELINQAKERLNPLSSPAQTMAMKRKQMDDDERSGTRSEDAKRLGHKGKRICLTLRPAHVNLSKISLDLEPLHPRRSRGATWMPTKHWKNDQMNSKPHITIGKIRRRFRTTTLPLGSKTKYDYHIGVML